MASYTYEFLDLGDEHSLGCKCCRFQQGIDLPMPKKLSHEEIAKQASIFSNCIRSNWTKLNAILKRSEPTIQKRWMKKTVKQRREILLTAWPNMSTSHRPDFTGFRKVLRNAPRSRTLPSAAFLWPYINLEDLLQCHHLLLFINSRGRNLPERFVSTDIREAHLGEGWDDEADDELYCMQFFGQRTPDTYGKLVKRFLRCGKRISIRTAATTHSKVLGLVALEIQEGIYAFLLSRAKLILHDIDPIQFFLAPLQPAPSIPELDSNEWPSFTAHIREVPYRVPEMMDLTRLKILAGSRRASAEDHLWLLKEDPGYFVDSLKEWKEHHEALMQHDNLKVWRTVAQTMIGDAFTLFLCWHWIYSKLDKMSTMETQLRHADHATLRLAREDEQAWAELQIVLAAMSIFPLSLLSKGLPSSPRMRHRYTQFEPGSSKRMSANVSHKFTDSERRVDLIFHAITHEDKQDLHGLHRLVQEIQHMSDTDSQASQLCDSWITSVFADLAIMSELTMRIGSLEPWATSWVVNGVLSSKAVETSTDSLFLLDTKLRHAIGQAFDGDLPGILLGNPLDGAFDYPAAKRHNEENVTRMRIAEQNLDELWSEVEFSVESKTGLLISEIIKDCLLEPRSLYRTAQWVPPLVVSRSPPVLTERDSNILPFSQESTAKDVTGLAKPKIKVKTRGVANVANNDCCINSPSSENEGTSPHLTAITVKVPKRAYKVLSALRPPTGAESHQRTEISWEEFLQAMNTIGLQPEKLYGSVWMFMPKANGECKVNAQRSIQFHEPKEVRRGSKIPPNMVRTFGRRLKHAFGWVDGMFVCE